MITLEDLQDTVTEINTLYEQMREQYKKIYGQYPKGEDCEN